MYEVKDDVLKLEHGQINKGLIAIARGKGGVGKSTVTVNLAVALSQLGHEVGIIDADVHGFSVPRIIGLEEEARALNEKEIIPPVAKNVKVVSMGSFVEEGNPVIWRAPLLAGALEQFMTDVHWGELDYLLLDLPPGTGDMPLNIMQKLPHAETLIITTPQITATYVAGRIGRMAEKMESQLLGVIENMAYYKCPECGHRDYIFGKGGGKELADELDTVFLGKLPLLTPVRKAGDEGKTVVTDELLGEEFKDIAEKIEDKIEKFDPQIKPLELNK
ncbi:MAG: Mrp/NBP35 family ATP-binding protein [Halanaerobiales bacterium]